MKPLDKPPLTIGAVVVTFHPGESFFRLLTVLRAHVSSLAVVDNASNPELRDRIQGVLKSHELRLLPENLGLAEALNIGVSMLRESGCEWVYLFDQDTEILEGFFEDYFGVLAANQGNDVAVIGSHYRRKGIDRPPEAPIRILPSFREAKAVITAGSLLSVAAFNRIGPFRSDFFIDWVDTEYCYRARRAGYRIIKLTQPQLSQTIGRSHQVQTWLGSVVCTDHDPNRHFFMQRNLILLAKAYFWMEPLWFLARAADGVKTAIRIALFEDRTRAKFKAMCRGLAAGIRGR